MHSSFWLSFLGSAALVGFSLAWGCGESFDEVGGGVGGAGGQAPVADAGSIFGLALVNPTCGTGDGGVVSSECTSCAAAACGELFVECFGAEWQTDLAGGVCTSFGQCVMGCECGDADGFRACLEALGQEPASACYECIVSLVGCEQDHCAEACADSTEDAGGVDDGGAAGHGSGSG
jgi:hypothetical protein